MTKHVMTLFRYWLHGHEAPSSTEDNLALLDAVKWAAGERRGVRMPNGKPVFVDWKGDPAHKAIRKEISKCND